MIRFANNDDIDSIMLFIKNHWQATHILANDRAFFEYLYVRHGRVNFVVSADGSDECGESGGINGLLGFIPYDSEYNTIALALWKALKDADGFAGIDMLGYLMESLDSPRIETPGMNIETTDSIMQFFGMNTGLMKHYYRLSNAKEYRIAEINDSYIPAVTQCQLKLRRIYTAEELFGVSRHADADRYAVIPKDEEYLEWRYFSHPVFNYMVFASEADKADRGRISIVTRIQEHEGGRCLRLVDVLGNYDLLSAVTEAIDHTMETTGCEYTDCYYTGLPEELFEDAGWRPVGGSGNIIPDHFEPYEARNTDIGFAETMRGAVMFKGDGDQDRPSLAP